MQYIKPIFLIIFIYFVERQTGVAIESHIDVIENTLLYNIPKCNTSNQYSILFYLVHSKPYLAQNV